MPARRMPRTVSDRPYFIDAHGPRLAGEPLDLSLSSFASHPRQASCAPSTKQRGRPSQPRCELSSRVEPSVHPAAVEFEHRPRWCARQVDDLGRIEAQHFSRGLYCIARAHPCSAARRVQQDGKQDARCATRPRRRSAHRAVPRCRLRRARSRPRSAGTA